MEGGQILYVLCLMGVSFSFAGVDVEKMGFCFVYVLMNEIKF